jgi:tetratricopeptide (TPR) repeat protein
LGAYKTLEFEEAYSFLKPTAEAQGPGLIYLNFHPDPYDQTLFVATYPFNASENPRLKPSEAKWAAILTNIHEEPYLKKIFPDGKWTWLSDGLRRTDGGLMLEIVPISQANKNLLMKWANANQSLKELTRLVMEFGVNPDQNQMLGVLDKAYPLFQNDRLLESRYWRIRALHLFAAGRNAEGIENEKKAIELGYPMADLYNEEGCFLFKETRRDEAKKAFKKAIGLKPNCTDAAANLQVLDQM